MWPISNSIRAATENMSHHHCLQNTTTSSSGLHQFSKSRFFHIAQGQFFAGKPTPKPPPWGKANPLIAKWQGLGGGGALCVEGCWECSVHCWGAFIEAQWQAVSSSALPNAMRHAWHYTPHKSKESSGLRTYVLLQTNTYKQQGLRRQLEKMWVTKISDMNYFPY